MKLPEIEISIKFKGTKKSEIKSITSSQDSFKIFSELFNKDTIEWTEEVIMLCLNQSNKCIGYYRISKGGLTGAVLDPKVVFTIALNCVGTTNLIIAHNHPSGNLIPSNADNLITNKLKECGKLLDIKLLDHIIITSEGYYSYADDGNI